MRSAIVLGAGMAGLGAALQLQARGWSVALVDRGEPGRETSYGNSGIIQAEAAEPYPMPRDWRVLLDIAAGRTNDVRFEWGSLHRHIGPLIRYWWHSAPHRHAAIAEAYSGLIARALPEHQALIGAAGAGDLARPGGFRILHRDLRALEKAIAHADRLRQRYGIASRTMSPEELGAAEPGLKSRGVGAIHWEAPWSIRDPGALATAYANLFRQRGGTVRHGEGEALGQTGAGWILRDPAGPIEADAAVVALGPWSPSFLRRFGYRFPMVRKRGYHRHWRDGRTLSLPLLDAANGYVMAPMIKGLRITTGAEFSAPDANAPSPQLMHAERAARDLIELGTQVETVPWRGTRPCMPDMLPVIGEAPRHPGLWLHFGHGHQGLTLGPATGRLLADMMSGEPSFVRADPFRPGRY